MKKNPTTNMWESPFWHPSVATDAVVFGFNSETNSLEILLIQRGVEPFKGKWALPGGFLQQGESAEQCVKRELFEETHVENIYMEQIGVFSEPDRDKGHDDQVISIAYFALVRSKDYEVIGDDDALKAVWFPINDYPELAFDHELILKKALSALQQRIHFAPIGFQLLDKEFTIARLHSIYRAILQPEGESTDKGKYNTLNDKKNFTRKLLKLKYIEPTGKKCEEPTPYKRPELYRFNETEYNRAKEDGIWLEL